jgi:hypothetical protein
MLRFRREALPEFTRIIGILGAWLYQSQVSGRFGMLVGVKTAIGLFTRIKPRDRNVVTWRHCVTASGFGRRDRACYAT